MTYQKQDDVYTEQEIQFVSVFLGLFTYISNGSLLESRLYVVCCRYLMCQNGEDLRRTAKWSGKGPTSRARLLDSLQGSWSLS